MGLWLLLLLPIITRKQNKRQRYSITFTEMAVEREIQDHRNLRRHMETLLCFSRARLATLSLCKGVNVILKRDKQDICVHQVDRMFAVGLSALKLEITGGEGTTK